MAQGLLPYTAGGDGVARRRRRAGRGREMHGSDNKQKISYTQWGLQLLLVLAVAMALWK